MFIKASQIAHLTDARYFAARHVDAIGFDLTIPNAAQQFLALAEWVEGVMLVGDLGLGSAADYQALVEQLSLQAVQFPHFAEIEAIRSLQQYIETCFFTLALEADDVEFRLAQIGEMIRDTDMLVLEAKQLNWADLKNDHSSISFEQIQDLCQQHSVLLDVQFAQADIADIQAALQLKGFQLCGSEEESVGIKSFDSIDDILDDVKPLWE